MNHRNEWKLWGKTKKCELEKVGNKRVFENTGNIEAYGKLWDSKLWAMAWLYKFLLQNLVADWKHVFQNNSIRFLLKLKKMSNESFVSLILSESLQKTFFVFHLKTYFKWKHHWYGPNLKYFRIFNIFDILIHWIIYSIQSPLIRGTPSLLQCSRNSENLIIA